MKEHSAERRWSMIVALLFGIAAAVIGGTAAAQTGSYPTMPIRVIVPFPAGGTSDIVARIVLDKVAADLGQPAIVDNRAGGNGVVGMQAGIRSRPDGYTLLQISAANITVQLLRENVYDWERDLIPIFGVGAVPYAIAVNGRSPIRNFDDLRAAAAATPAGISYGSGSAGSPSHLCPARVTSELRMNAVHVPYRGQNSAVEALLGNQVQFVCATVVDVGQLVRAGDLRLLAVTSEERLPEQPDVPTMAELGFADFYAATWYAYLAPANTPAPVIERLSAAFLKAGADPSAQDQLRRRGFIVRPRNGAEVAQFIRADAERWRRVIQENRIRMDE